MQGATEDDDRMVFERKLHQAPIINFPTFNDYDYVGLCFPSPFPFLCFFKSEIIMARRGAMRFYSPD
jgi:hypothetical protein